ncbi:hypothetical protein QLX67_13035 [Balneolaceae bacterium ANBcel3]|nr:hypothetical protein [Balneolaceae bacterium ANBcel3]
MEKLNIQEIKVGLKINFMVLITFSALFLSACAGKIVPEEERIETTYNFDAISGFNYFEAREVNRRNRRNPSGQRDNSDHYYRNTNGNIKIGKNTIVIESEPMNGNYAIRSVRKRDMDGNRVRYTYKTDKGEFRIVVNRPTDVHSVSLTINNEDFFQFLVRR